MKRLLLFLLLVPQISYEVTEGFKTFFKKSLLRGSQGVGLLIGAVPALDLYASNEASKLALQNIPESELVTDEKTLAFVRKRLFKKHGIHAENLTVIKTYNIPGQMAMYSLDSDKAVLFLNVDPTSVGLKTELEIFLKEKERNLNPVEYRREKAQIKAILDHEAGHHLENHTAKMVIAKGGFTVGFQGLSAVLSNALAVRSLPIKMASAVGRGIGVALATEVADKGYSRGCEREADENVVKKADSQLAIGDFFGSCAEIAEQETLVEKMMRTHPSDKERANTAYKKYENLVQLGNKSSFPPLTTQEKKAKGEQWLEKWEQYQNAYNQMTQNR